MKPHPSQITLFGECVLSEDGTPSDCQLLEQALEEFQEALETCDITSTCAPPERVRPETDMEYRKRMANERR